MKTLSQAQNNLPINLFICSTIFLLFVWYFTILYPYNKVGGNSMMKGCVWAIYALYFLTVLEVRIVHLARLG